MIRQFTLRRAFGVLTLTAILLAMLRTFGSNVFERQLTLQKMYAMGAVVVHFDQNGQVVSAKFKGSKIRLDGIEHFKSMRQLDFSASNVDGEQLAKVGVLNRLQILDLSHTQIGDNDFNKLASLPELQYLRIDYTLVSDSILKDLSKFPRLMGVDVTGTQISKDDITSALSNHSAIGQLHVQKYQSPKVPESE